MARNVAFEISGALFFTLLPSRPPLPKVIVDKAYTRAGVRVCVFFV